ncbi:MAG: MmgE/PrpD family protein [Betaproteobacteria bacterium]|nr:MmgE/PrpD family protein [Betaproteobacteria bacterium]
MDETTGRLVDYAMDARYETLSAATRHECKRRIIDTYACAMGAYAEPVCGIARTTAGQYSGPSVASVWGSAIKTVPEMAAFTNGVMLRFLDVSDTFQGKGRGHPSDVMSAVLAVGEAAHADGSSVIAALTAAYDVYCSFEETIDINVKAWDHTVYGVVAGAIGVGKILGLSREQMANAVALALAPNMALMVSRHGNLSNWKGCAGANASRNSVFAAMLAHRGLTGPDAVFEGKGGLWEVLGESFAWSLPGPDAPRMITRTDLKSLPMCYHGQSAVLAAFELRKRVRIADIAEIEIDTYRVAVQMMAGDPSRWAPTTHETADHSLPYVVSMALLDGKINTASFAHECLTAPSVTALMPRVKVRENERLSKLYPQGAPAKLTIRLKSGEELTHEIEYPKGHSRNPMDDAQVEDKFRSMFSAVGGTDQCEQALRVLWNIDKAKDIMIDLFEPLAAIHRSSGSAH